MKIPFWFETIWQDIRLAARGLLRTPGFAFIAVATLALGIGANTTIFSVVQSILLRPLPYDQPDRIIEIHETHPDRGWTISFSHPNFWDLWDQNKSFEALAASTGDAMNLTGFDTPERVQASVISADLFRVLRLPAVYGRTFQPGEDQPDADHRIVLLGNGFWMRRFGGDPAVVGSRIMLDDEPYTVVGVMGSASPFPGQTDVFVPLVRGSNQNRSDHRLFVMGRLKAGVTVEAAQADLENIAAGIGLQDADGPLGIAINPSSDWIAGDQLRTALWVLMGAVGFLLMIACVNLANLLLARVTGRQREAALCAALGATRGRLTSRLLTESLLISLLGGALGVGLAFGGIRLVQVYGPENLPRMDQISLDPRVLAFTLLVSLLTGLLIGLVPGLQMGYSNLLTTLRDGDRGMAGARSQNHTRNLLVSAEAALALVLMVGAVLLIRSFGELQKTDTGFDPTNRLSFQVSLPTSYDTPQTADFLRRFLARLQDIPQVQSAGAVNMAPISGGSVGMGFAQREQMEDEKSVVWSDWRLVTPDYFRTMGLPLLLGENFTDQDQIGNPWKVVISKPLADRIWPGENPIGRRAALWVDPERIAEVVGVVGGMRERGPQADPTLVVYLPYYGAGWPLVSILAHTTGDPSSVVPLIRTVLAEIDPNLPISNVARLDDVVTAAVAGDRFNTLLLASFAGVALLLALAGIYGVLAYSVARRTHEIGVRVALGASPRNVFQQIIWQGMQPVITGTIVGVIAAVGLSRYLSTLLFEIKPTDPITYVGVSLSMGLAALAACYWPARKALSVDPRVALTSE